MTKTHNSRFSLPALTRRLLSSLDRFFQRPSSQPAFFESLEPRIALAANGLNATYYNNDDFTGTTVSRVDSRILNNWGENAPVAGIDPDSFSVRWTGYLKTGESGNYTFQTLSDDGVRLWVNDTLLIDNWSDHALTQDDSPPIFLNANTAYDIKVEYYDRSGTALMMLVWTYPSGGQETIPSSRFYTSPVSFAPQVYYITGPDSSPVRTPVDSISVHFDQTLDISTLDWSDFGLYRNNSSTNLITSGAGLTIAAVPGAPETYTLSGLSQYTSISADYKFTASATGVKNLAGTTGTGSQSISWTTSILTLTQVDTPASVQSGPVTSVPVHFSGSINPSTFSWEDLSLTRDGGANLITSGSGITISATADSKIYNITGLDSLTAAAGNYTLTVNAAGIQSSFDAPGLGSLQGSWTTDLLTIASLAQPTAIRTNPVFDALVRFSQPINLATFNWADLTLTRNSGANLITGSSGITVELAPGETTKYLIKGLASLTGVSGNYTLTVNGAGIQTSLGGSASNSLSTSWNATFLKPTTLGQPATNRTNPVYDTAIRFSEPIDLSSFTWADLTLTRNGGANLITAGSGITIELAPGETTKYLIKGLASLTNLTGSYALTVSAANIKSAASGSNGSGSLTVNWSANIPSPLAITSISQPATNRTNPVYSIAVRFNHTIDLSTFTWADMILSLNSGANLLSASTGAGLTITLNPGETSLYTISGFAPLTAAIGSYTLTINPSGITPTTGTTGSTSQSTSWTKIA